MSRRPRGYVLLFVLPLAALLSCAHQESNTLIAPDHPELRYTGRWNFDAPARPWVGWQGSTVSVAFRGSGISASVDPGPQGERLRVIVDGEPQEPARQVPGGTQTIQLATGLDDGLHVVTLMKEEYASSVLEFHGFDLGDGEIAELPPAPDKRIAFFGDSNMEGYSLYSEKNEGRNGTYFAYPATASRMLGAEMQLQAVGSATLDGHTPNDIVSFVHSEAYEAEDPAYSDSYQPDVIVVNAGANDIFRVDPNNRKEATKQHYRNAISALRGAYGETPHIILFNAYGWSSDEPARYNQEIVDEIGGNLSKLDFPWCWEQWHGDMVDHSGQAWVLANYIASLDLGFSLQRGLDVMNGYGSGFDVANGSFEGTARDAYGAFGWRYFEDGVEQAAIADARDGDYVIRLDAGEKVHQCVDATGDFEARPTRNAQQYRLTASIRSVGDKGVAVLGADYQAEELYQRENPELRQFEVVREWDEYCTVLTAPDGSWQTYVVLASAEGTLEFDKVSLHGVQSGLQSTCNPTKGKE